MWKIHTRQLATLIFALITLSLHAQIESTLEVEDYESFEDWLAAVNQLRLQSPESATQSFEDTYQYYIENRDTLNAVNTLVQLAINHGHQVDYQSAYDNLWKALLLADHSQNDKAKIPVYIQLGRYYSFYKRRETALEYFQQALTLAKQLNKAGKVGNSVITNCYYALSSTYREFRNAEIAKAYIDSCYQYTNIAAGGDHLYFLKFEQAYVNDALGKHQSALDTLLAIQPWFEEYYPGFQVLLFAYTGDVYLNLQNKDQAELFYQKALVVSRQYKSHLDFTPTIHKRLSNLYASEGDFSNAFSSLKNEQKLDATFFDSRSPNNKSLLEIKDEFRVEKEKQNQLIQEQRIAQLEHEERVSMLKRIIYLTLIVSLLFIGFLYVKYIQKKHRVEKDLIRKKRELEVKQANELLELKNKELATSSLKLIEKDEILATLKERLSQGNGDIKAPELKKIVRSISHSNAQNWEEFEARFMSVNKNFYEKLNTKYPKLSRGDQKLCALVKLNLSSKEMAKLLGISIESVHTNRYRLRKKLGLTREVSLTEFVAKL